MEFTLKQIGTVKCGAEGFAVELSPEYRDALTGLSGFGYVQVLWWFDKCDVPEARAVLTLDKPYVNGPDRLGVFATRSPVRPNPIAVSPSRVAAIDEEKGVLYLEWIDADDGSPVLDIKPYTPCIDRIETPEVPDWCAHWPKRAEDSAAFDWEAEFNF